MSPWLWWALAAVLGGVAVWESLSADPYSAAAAWVACAALLAAGWRERAWRRAARVLARRLREGASAEPAGRPQDELASAIHAVLQDLREELGRARAKSDRLQELLDVLPWGVVVTDDRRRVVWVNRSAAVLLGVQPPHVHRASAVAAFRHHEVDRLLDRAQQQGEARADLEAGRVLGLVARRLAGGGFLLLVQDTTAQRRAEAVRRDFVANVSHELRTPLASLRALAESLQEGALEDRALADRFLAQMLEEVDRMSRLVNDLLDLSALEAGVVQLRQEAWQAQELLEAVARRYAPVAVQKGVHLTVGPGNAQLRADRDRLEQALGNLVENAVKYTPPGGRVELGVELRGGEVHLVVEDTGPGIPPEHLPRVFERFYRVDSSRSRAEGGTGLGLAIVKHIALAHGGRVEARNRPEGGARFAVVLPPPSKSGPEGLPGS